MLPTNAPPAPAAPAPLPTPIASYDEELAWESQRDPRLPACLVAATDVAQHLRHCARCRRHFCGA